MKWLIIQSAGQHNGSDGWTPNDYLRECFALQHALQQNGEICDVWGLRHSNFKEEIDFNSYDNIVLLENYEWDWVPDLTKITAKKYHWIIDLHCQKNEIYAKYTRQCDVVLHSTKARIDGYKKLCPDQEHIWFANAVDDRYFNYEITPKTNNAVFLCSPFPARIQFCKRIGAPHKFAVGVDMFKAIRETKININNSLSNDVNYRNFETIGLGTCLLTNYLPELETLGFKHGHNCLMYKNPQDARKLLNHYLNCDRYVDIAKEGLALAKVHSYTERAKLII